MIKSGIQLMAVIIASPFIIVYLLLNGLLKNDALFASFSQLLSLLPGKLGSFIRVGFYRFAMVKCSAEVVVAFAALFSQRDTELASGVYIGPQCNIGKCSIGKNTLIGSGVHIMSGKGQHNFDDLNTPIKDQGGHFQKVAIGEDCWVGNSALIMANVGKHCVVAAGSVVINEVPDFAIVAGNPAKVIKMRGTDVV